MKPKTMPVLEQCIETGIKLGLNRAHKHIDNPTEQQIAATIEHAIWDELYEWFDFPELETKGE